MRAIALADEENERHIPSDFPVEMEASSGDEFCNEVEDHFGASREHLEPRLPGYYVLDFYHHMMPEQEPLHRRRRRRYLCGIQCKACKVSLRQRDSLDHFNENILTVLFLACLGVICAVLGFSVNVAEVIFLDSRNKLLAAVPFGFIPKYLFFAMWAVMFGVVSVAFVLYVAHSAAGSGIPEMKSILNGIVLYRFLSFNTLVAKTGALIAALAAGLSIGKEGPFVHMSACVVRVLLKIPTFKHFRGHSTLSLPLYAGAVAAGVVACFGAPIGGVLFSIEVTSSHHFSMANLATTFFCAMAGTLCVRVLGWHTLYPEASALFTAPKEVVEYSPIENVFFAGLGVAMGLIGTLFIVCVGYLVNIRVHNPLIGKLRYGIVIPVTLVTALVMYPLAQWVQDVTIEQLLSTVPLELSVSAMVTFACSKLALTALALTLPIPVGVATPLFYCGAVIGRLVGYSLPLFMPPGIVASTVPAGYAMVGGAALSCAVMRSVSMGIVTLELTGQTHHTLPILLGCLAAYGTAQLFTSSIFDVIMTLRGVPFLPRLRRSAYHLRAREIMQPTENLRPVTLTSSYVQILELMHGNDFLSFPIVDSAASKRFLGTVLRGSLLKVINRRIAYLRRRETLKRNQAVNSGETQGLLGGVTAALSRKKYLSLFEEQLSGDNHADGFDQKMVDEVASLDRLEGMDAQFDWAAPDLLVDEAPFQISPLTTLQRVDLIFRMAGTSHVWVVDLGQLEGVISKKDLITEGIVQEVAPFQESTPFANGWWRKN